MFFVCERRRSRRLSKRDPQRAQRAIEHRMAGSRCSRRRSAGGDGGTRFSVPSAPTKMGEPQGTRHAESQQVKKGPRHEKKNKKKGVEIPRRSPGGSLNVGCLGDPCQT